MTFACLSTTDQRTHDPPKNTKNSAPEALVVVGSWRAMDLRAWHRPACTAMAYERASDRLVVAGGSLRDGQFVSRWLLSLAGCRVFKSVVLLCLLFIDTTNIIFPTNPT